MASSDSAGQENPRSSAAFNLLERPQSGKVIVDGKDLLALNAAQLRETRRKIGMIFQHFNLMRSRTVAQKRSFSAA